MRLMIQNVLSFTYAATVHGVFSPLYDLAFYPGVVCASGVVFEKWIQSNLERADMHDMPVIAFS
jgi:hypothetical protein